jgi:hypothetical protein
MKCPACKDGYNYGFGCPGFIPVTIKCHICDGSNVLPDNIKYDPDRGKAMRDDRVNKEPYESLREIAKRTGTEASKISEQERGYFRT